MKPHRMRMVHDLVVNYNLFKKMEVLVSFYAFSLRIKLRSIEFRDSTQFKTIYLSLIHIHGCKFILFVESETRYPETNDAISY